MGKNNEKHFDEELDALLKRVHELKKKAESYQSDNNKYIRLLKKLFNAENNEYQKTNTNNENK